jgi:hypothetical protein
MNLTGGWHWHVRAWRSQERWAPAASQIADWLMAQTMPRQQLVLIGASAGWMLPTAWLAQFEEVHAWDIDPWAKPLFYARHGRHLKRQGKALHLHTGDGLALLPELVRRMPGAFFWFDNVLGQLRFTGWPLQETARRLGQIQHQMKGVAWGSLHDRMSGPRRPDHPWPQSRAALAGWAMESSPGQDWLRSMGAVSPWLDHLTEQVLPQGTPVQYTAWPFKPGYAHWLEMGWCPQTR